MLINHKKRLIEIAFAIGIAHSFLPYYWLSLMLINFIWIEASLTYSYPR